MHVALFGFAKMLGWPVDVSLARNEIKGLEMSRRSLIVVLLVHPVGQKQKPGCGCRRHVSDEFFNVVARIRRIGDQHIKARVLCEIGPDFVTVFLFVVHIGKSELAEICRNRSIAIVRIINAEL